MTEVEEKTVTEEETNTGPKWGRMLVWGGLLVLLTIVALGLKRTQEGPVGPGQEAPAFVLTTFDGQEIDSADLAGKVIVLNFWASWCKPCEQEAADLETAWQYYQEGGDVVFLGVDYVDTEPEAMVYMNKFNISYPNGADLGTRISQSFRIRGVPETYIIDQDGVLTHTQIGPFTSLLQITAVIDPLLGQ
ncbi:MAG: TlpA family protein disulfide reductase [Anaerolineales bacterium]|nr:TlpA family protein disulfide reductase [Chloroflexota bacterium]MBL6979638.1 TlpA family protein disulfide reductase [Anaerolineales bacterium]